MDHTELTLAGVDVHELMNRLLQNTGLARMLVSKLVEDQTYARLAEAIARNDMAESAAAGHTLKGVCGNMSLKLLFELLQHQQTLFKAGETDQAAALMDQITPAYETAIHHMKLWLNET